MTAPMVEESNLGQTLNRTVDPGMVAAGASVAGEPDLTTTTPQIFSISPWIRIPLFTFYIALTLPLPFLATATAAPVPSSLLWLGLGLGAIALQGSLSEQVVVTAQGIQVRYPDWIRWLIRRGWALDWGQIAALKPRSTGQGGLVYYFVDADAQRAYLLPMRVAGFAALVQAIAAHTDLDLRDVKPLAQPWMYGALMGISLLLLAVDGWTLWAITQVPLPLG